MYQSNNVRNPGVCELGIGVVNYKETFLSRNIRWSRSTKSQMMLPLN